MLGYITGLSALKYGNSHLDPNSTDLAPRNPKPELKNRPSLLGRHAGMPGAQLSSQFAIQGRE